MLLLAFFQATLILELAVFLFFFFPTIVVYEKMTKKLSQSQAFGTAIGSCVADPSCAVCVDMTTAGGIIQSLNYPAEYPPNVDCFITIQSPSYTTITLNFNTFSVETCCDFVSVFDGTSTPLQVGLNGFTIPASSTTSASTQTMTIKFTTNGDNIQIPTANAPGQWQATYTFQNVPNI